MRAPVFLDSLHAEIHEVRLERENLFRGRQMKVGSSKNVIFASVGRYNLQHSYTRPELLCSLIVFH